MPSATSPDVYREQRYREGKFTCDVCGNQWPMSHHRLQRGGEHVGVVCCYEPDGDEFTRDMRRAAASVYAAQRSAEELQPPKTPEGYPYSGSAIETSERAIAAVLDIVPIPIVVYLSGGVATAVITGLNFSSTDTFTYGQPFVTNNSPPSLIGTTEWDLSLSVSGGNAGKFPITFNGTQIWQQVLEVR